MRLYIKQPLNNTLCLRLVILLRANITKITRQDNVHWMTFLKRGVETNSHLEPEEKNLSEDKTIEKIHQTKSIIVIITGNLLTVVALLRCQKLRVHATTAFVISLAVSDLLFSAINLPLTASR